MPDSTSTPTAPPTIDMSDYSALLEIARVACHRIPNVLTDELDISDEYLDELENIANALPSPVPATPTEDENKELRDLVQEIKHLRILVGESLNAFQMIRDEANLPRVAPATTAKVYNVWNRLKEYTK